MSPIPRLFAVAFSTLIAAATTQSPSPMAHAVGFARPDGDLSGAGPGYRVDFAGEVTFTPALGAAAPRAYPLRLRTVSVAREVGPRAGPWPARAPERQRSRVVYRRTGFVEQYDLRLDGLELSYEFDALPAGRGDLVVRVAVDTDLPLVAGGRDGVRFEIGGLGGVRIDDVVGIASDGSRARGTMRFLDGVLELRLPGAFVASAALPLLLDPLIGAISTVGKAEAFRPDIAFGSKRYLAVWEQHFGGSAVDVQGQLLDESGKPTGTLLPIRAKAVASTGPRVGYVRQTDQFLVAWTEGTDILAACVDAGTGAVSSPVTVASGTGNQADPDVGGDSTGTDDEAVVVWSDSGTATIHAAQVRAAATGPAVTGSTVDVSVMGTDSRPTIAQSGGSAGRYLVAWLRLGSSTSDIVGAVIDRNLNVLASDLVLSASPGTAQNDPAVDGDGTSWIAAWSTDEPTPGGHDIECAAVTYNATRSAAEVFAPVVVEGDPNDDEIEPAVAWLGNSALVLWADEDTSGSYDGGYRTIDPFSCAQCEPEGAFEPGTSRVGLPAAASRLSGGGADDEAFLVWQSTSTANKVVVQGSRFRADDGTATDLGGGCASGGTALAACARVANGGFELRVRGLPRKLITFALLSPSRLDLPCGSCRIVPDPFTGLVAIGSSFTGSAALNVPIPNEPLLSGRSFFMQWLVSDPAGCGGFATSNALRVQID